MSTSNPDQANKPVVDENREVLCPDCKTKVKLGKVGIANLTERHQGSRACESNRKRQEEEEALARQRAAAAKFFAPRAAPIPSTVSSPSLIVPHPPRVYSQLPSSRSLPAIVPSTSTAGFSGGKRGCQRGHELLDTFHAKIKALPSSVGIAGDDYPLAGFTATALASQDVEEDAWETWDRPIGNALDGLRERKQEYVKLGEGGLLGFWRFLHLLVSEHGVLGAVLEPKLERLIEAMEEIAPCIRKVESNTTPPSATTDKGTTPSLTPSSPPVIDVDSFPDDALDTSLASLSPSQSLPPCPGLHIQLAPDQSPHTSWPFAINDVHGDPWDTLVIQGKLYLRARKCSGTVSAGQQCCRACNGLENHPILRGIRNRMENGIKETTNFAYHPIGSLQTMLKRRGGQVRALRLRRLNDAQKLAGKVTKLDEYKQWVMAVGSGRVQRVDALIRINCRRKGGIRGLSNLFIRAANHRYKPRDFTEEEMLSGLVMWRMGGARSAGVGHRALGLPSLRRNKVIQPLVSSPLAPTTREVEKNRTYVMDVLDSILEGAGVVHQVLMIDEIKVEERPRYDEQSGKVVGICREHARNVPLQLDSEADIELMLECIERGEAHIAVEATVAALGLLSAETRLYSARPILISGSCKRESGKEHMQLIHTAFIGSQTHRLRTVSIASDGESRRGEALFLYTFKKSLAPDSPIYDQLAGLPLMNLQVGDDDVTADKDAKHVIKRLRNLLLRERGAMVHGILIKPSVTRKHLRSSNVTDKRINYLLNPNDKQDVKLSYDLLSEIWSLPSPEPHHNPLFHATHQGFQIMGSLFRKIVLPYICVDLTLAEQLEHLSAAAHLLLALYSDEEGGSKFMPSQLYLDIQIMVKNVFFCVAKAKVDNPGSKFYIILLGTDRLEALYGILRTMVGNDANLDVLQLALRLTGTTEVSTILARFPQWDRAPRRLKLPSLNKDGFEVYKEVDHVGPSSWRGDTSVDCVNLYTCWKRGRIIVEEEFPWSTPILKTHEQKYPKSDIFSPSGKDLVKIPTTEMEIDDTVDEWEKTLPQVDAEEACALAPDLEDTIINEIEELNLETSAATTSTSKPSTFFHLDDVKVSKSRFLSQMWEKYRREPNSTDRLKRVASQQKYAAKKEADLTLPNVIEDDPFSDRQKLEVNCPVATILRCSDQYFTCIGEIIDIQIHSASVDQIGLDILHDPSVTITVQMLYLVPSTVDDDATMKHDWRWSGRTGPSFKVPGILVDAVNPGVSTCASGAPFYLFESRFLISLGPVILERVANASGGLPKVPSIKMSDYFPYRERTGKVCFICQDERVEGELEASRNCAFCSPTVPLPQLPQALLAHNAAHILYDPSITAHTEPCGMCLRSGKVCCFYLRGKSSIQIDFTRSVCPNKRQFSYAVAAKSTAASPASNVPVRCPLCAPEQPGVWRYNLRAHLRNNHPTVPLDSLDSQLWEIPQAEQDLLKSIWETRNREVKRRKGKAKPSFTISEAHSSRMALRNDDEEESGSEGEPQAQTDSEGEEEDEMASCQLGVEGNDEGDVEMIYTPGVTAGAAPMEDVLEGEVDLEDISTKNTFKDIPEDPTPYFPPTESTMAADGAPPPPAASPTRASVSLAPARVEMEPEATGAAVEVLIPGETNLSPATPSEGPTTNDTEQRQVQDEDEDSDYDIKYSRRGRKRRARKLDILLRECVCGIYIEDDEKEDPTMTIKCRRDACQTGWIVLDSQIGLSLGHVRRARLMGQVVGEAAQVNGQDDNLDGRRGEETMCSHAI